MAGVNNETLAAALVGILGSLVLLVAILIGLRWYRTRRNNRALLPTHQNEKLDSNSSFTAGTSISSRSPSRSKSLHFSADSKDANGQPALPEIRITFPEEVDEMGKAQSGRCVVVRISEQGSEGFEPYNEKLPSYQRDANDRFQSLDLERIGGLQEKPSINKAMAAA